MTEGMHIPMDQVHLSQYARNTAKALRVQGRVSGRRSAGEIRALWRGIGDCRRSLARWSAGAPSVPAAVEWLLDNGYLAEQACLEAERAFRGAGNLRKTREGGPAVFEAARAAVWAVPDLDQGRLSLFLEQFQQVVPLWEKELSLLVPAMAWALVRRLEQQCRREERLRSEDGQEQTAREMGELFTALRTLSGADWSALLEGASLVEGLLARDPAGEYRGMDDETRARYRAQVCRLARRLGLGETEVAQQALELAQKGEGRRRHIGWYLFRQPLGREEKKGEGGAYGAGILAITAILSLTIGALLNSPFSALLLVLPLSDIVKNCVDFLAAHLVPPRPVHRMELRGGVPRSLRTLCVVACLLTDEDSGDRLAALLERYRLANRDCGEELRLGLLADLPDSPTPMGREQRKWVARARRAVDGLNRKYGGGFYLFFRTPAFQKTDERYMGWERKRGALVELVRLLMGRPGALQVLSGDRQGLEGTRYVITLDSDTSLNVGAARKLIGAMAHPLNQPEIDPGRRVVTEGYGLLQPRISVELAAANRSLFSRIFAGQGGVDPYGSTASDVYHDLFDQGTYTGKGIFQVEAFYRCLDGRIPENTVLSHDLLEGSYLHAGLLGEVELTDGYPYKVNSYFARLHRWVRGDWQLLPWLGRRVPVEGGGRQSNPLSALARWKILDNLRRSLSPVSTLLALILGICLSGRIFAAAAAVAVLAAASNLLLSGAELAARRGAGLRTRYHSTVIAGFAGVVLQTLVQLLFLPYHAWICASAACTALWRMGVTQRDLLAWVTADQAERRDRGGLWEHYRRQWPAVLVGAVTLLGAQLRIGGAVGVVWLLSPMAAWLMSRPVAQRRGLSQADRAFLLHQGGLMWNYFSDFLREEDHWLPPDNWQEQPAVGLARRTSPTNIGMALLCVMAAADLDLIPRERGTQLLERMLETVEGLEKWHGHLYNWYETPSASPMRPRYVSTVDSGNLCGCLIALREGLYEWGEDVLARRAEALSDAMDFTCLYDAHRRLFTVGYEVERERSTQGWYDLMASEARQTSYLAVARGEVEARHWRRLGRMLLRDNDYSGMASWTGTMFEYFMPNLLLPCEENSLMYESLAFCIYAQKRRAARAGVPWGISESAFYAFDSAQNYQYKAHGVQALALKRGLDRELVVAPYASFLALPVDPSGAVRNLRRLRDLGMEGKYGLYEAVDFTPERGDGSGRGEVVRSYMVHHLGMSLVAVDNALEDGVMQRRFLRDCSMSAYRELLQERVPVGAPTLRPPEREAPEKPERAPAMQLERSGQKYSRLAPERHLVSNGAYTVLVSDSGSSVSFFGPTALTLERAGEVGAPAGVSWFFRDRDGLHGLTPAPLYQTGPEYGWSFSSGKARWTAKLGQMSTTTEVEVPLRENGEARTLTLRWEGAGHRRGEVLCYLEPVLARSRDYDAHPAFSKLFLESIPLPDGAAFLRRPRGSERTPALAVVWRGEGASYTTSRERGLGRGGLRALAWDRELGGETGPVLDPCLLLRIPVDVEGGRPVAVRLAMAAGEDLDQAQTAARRLLERRGGGADHRLEDWGRRLGLDERQLQDAFSLLGRLTAQEEGWERPPQSELWPFGVSGDVPVALGEVRGQEELERALVWCRQHRFLRRWGFTFDLVLVLDEGGDYRRPARGAILEELRQLGAESALGGVGGIHLVDRAVGDPAPLAAWAQARLPLEPRTEEERPARTLPPFRLRPGLPEVKWEGTQVILELDGRLPPAGWSQILASPTFGWLTDETGNGLLWQGNAREGRLTPWSNDPLAVGGWESLVLEQEGRERALLAEGDGLACTVTYGPGFVRWEKVWSGGGSAVRGFVPLDRDCRVLLIDLKGPAGELVLRQREREMRWSAPENGRLVLTTAPDGRGGLDSRVEGAGYREAEGELARTLAWWGERVGALRVHTPDPELDRYLNGWALYQVTACRLFARTSQYQNGGAYGFRDQLQDVRALMVADPDLAREQILRASERQFVEGDVQHWWHPPQGKGVRTRISDDLLWLPFVVARYCAVTGDRTILDEQVPFLTSPVLGANEQERYETPAVTQERASVYDHALRAIRCVEKRGTGAHGLPLFGGGDWNDGMNRVGSRGRGESVWLAWFGALTMSSFAPLCRERGEEETARELEEQAAALSQAAQKSWDGAWYLRGYYDDGTPLGGSGGEECRIDSVAQSFAALAPGMDRERADRAVSSALEQLFDREHQVVRLLTPPFTGGGHDPGYIRGYLPGVRENGGQYTHAAVWLALACFRLERPEEGWQVLRCLLPGHHDPAVYRTEPYVLSADVYANPAHRGRGGWSWYTGAAGWYYTTAVEELLGVQMEEGRLFLRPCLPPDWLGWQGEWKAPNGARFHIQVTRTGQKKTLLDGSEVQQGVDWKSCSGEHWIQAEC